jgi:hypothetical protein
VLQTPAGLILHQPSAAEQRAMPRKDTELSKLTQRLAEDLKLDVKRLADPDHPLQKIGRDLKPLPDDHPFRKIGRDLTNLSEDHPLRKIGREAQQAAQRWAERREQDPLASCRGAVLCRAVSTL